MVEPPVSPVRTEDRQQFSLLFVGGVPLENYQGSLEPTYKSKVPTLLGCLSGLMIGSKLFDMRDSSYWFYYPKEKGNAPVPLDQPTNFLRVIRLRPKVLLKAGLGPGLKNLVGNLQPDVVGFQINGFC